MNKQKINFKYTVKELIAQLEKMPSDLPVITTGYESGYENIMQPKVIKVLHVENSKYYDGEFQEAEEKSNNGFDAVILEREVRNV